jgi:hypothetical protein
LRKAAIQFSAAMIRAEACWHVSSVANLLARAQKLEAIGAITRSLNERTIPTSRGLCRYASALL